MIPRLDDNLIGSGEKFNTAELNNLKDITNLNTLKENNYHHTENMKMDLVVYDDSIHKSLNYPSSTKQQPCVYNVEDEVENHYGVYKSDFKDDPKENQQQQPSPPPNQLGLIGLQNLGNTCYMNSGLQCLFNNKRLIVFFLNEYLKNSSKINLANNSLTSCFISLMKKVWSSKRDYNVIKPNEFKEIMSQNYSQFQGFRQHDCQEFLTLFLGTLHDQINQGLNNNNNNNNNNSNNNKTKSESTSLFDTMNEKTKSNDESPLSNCSNDLMDLSRTTSPKSSLSVSTSSTYCDQLSEEEIDHSNEDKKIDLETNQTVINPIQRLMPATSTHFNHASNNVVSKSLVKTISKDELKNSLQLSVKELVSKDTKLINNNLNLNQDLSYDSKKLLKTSIDNELICSTAKQLNSQQMDSCTSLLNNYDYSDLCNSDSTSTNSSTTSILKRNKKRNNSNSTSTTNHHNNNHHNNNLSEHSFEDLNNNSPKRIKLNEVESETEEQQQQFDTLKSEKFSSEYEWNKYLTKNKSIIVDEFQGQFKSTVKCSSCSTVSITYEPFMYLPVNLPNALERQIFVIFVPSQSNAIYNSDSKSSRRYLITLNKHDKLDKLSNMLKELLIKDEMATESTQLVFAEVEEKFVNKVLDNNTFLKYVDDKFRDLYAFELTELMFTTFPQLPKLWNQTTTSSSSDQTFLSSNNNLDYDPNTLMNNPTFINDISSFNNSNPQQSTTNKLCISNTTSHNFNQYNQPEEFSQDIDNLIDNLKDVSPSTTTTAQMTTITTNVDNMLTNQFETSSKALTDDLITVVDSFDTCNLIPIQLSCAICLEDKDSSQLLIHPTCSCQLCPQCLDMTVKHYSENENNFLCPTCSDYIDKTDFVPFGSSKRPQANLFTTNYYLIPILFRIQEKRNYNNFKIVIRPILLRLPNMLNGSELYDTVDRFVPAPVPYSLCFVTKTGQKCVRCDWGSMCNGCEIARIGDVFINQNDNIAVEFDSSFTHELDSLMPDAFKQIIDHPSIHNYKKPIKLTLQECLKSFNTSEVLDDDNPWFCKQCNSNQKAKKSLTIWKSPETLIVYLKRFVFLDMNSIKIDESVEFPIEKFDISPYYQVDNKFKEESDGLIYDLKSIICHSGNMQSGHYTAFSKSAWNNKWYYFNDESVLELEPSSSDERAYILFYQRTNNSTNLNFLNDENKK